MKTACLVRPLQASDKVQAAQFLREQWGGERVVAHGVVYYPAELPGFVAEGEGEWLGLVTYQVQGEACEIVTLNAKRPFLGFGSSLLEKVIGKAKAAGCRRLWLITTNDNLQALRFYQRRGFVLTALHINALARSRQFKPQIPLVGNYGIPLRDEIELTLYLDEIP